MQYQVQINEIKTASLYFGCRLSNNTLKDEDVHSVCNYVTGENRSCVPSIGKVVGVYLNCQRKWVRGLITEVICDGATFECNVFLIDKGYYRNVKKKTHIIALNGMFPQPPEFVVLALEGVLPNAAMAEEANRYLQDIFLEGKIIFVPKTSGEEAQFGDIFIKPIENTNTNFDKNKRNTINLKAELLKEGFVTESQNYMEDVSKLLAPMMELINSCGESKKTPPKSIIEVEKEQKRIARRENRTHSTSRTSRKDTGYSSEDSYDKPIFVPAGSTYNPPKGRKSRSEEFQLPKNCLVERARAKSCSTRSQRQKEQTYSDRKVLAESCPSETEDRKDRSPLVSKPPKRVSWGGTSCESDSMNCQADSTTQKKKRNVFNIASNIKENPNTKVEISNIATPPLQISDSAKTQITSSESISSTDSKPEMSRQKELKMKARQQILENANRMRSSDAAVTSTTNAGVSDNLNTSVNDSTSSSTNINNLNISDCSSAKESPNTTNSNILDASACSVASDSFNTSISSSTKSNFLDVSVCSVGNDSLNTSVSSTNKMNTSNVSEMDLSNVSAVSSNSDASSTMSRSKALMLKARLAIQNAKANASNEAVRIPSLPTPVLNKDGERIAVEIHSPPTPVLNDDEERIRKSQEKLERAKALEEYFQPTEEELARAGARHSTNVGFYSTIQNINKAAGVLVHTNDERMIQPITSLSDSHLHGKIIQKLEQHQLRELNRCQTVSYPAICAKENFVVVSPPESGKTAGYVVPLASNLLETEYYQQVPRGYGPKVVVIAPFCKKVEQAANMFRDLTKDVRITHAHGGGAEKDKKVELLRGVDVLVTSPRCLLRLLNNEWTDLKRLCHLVMDDSEIMFDEFHPEIQQILELVNKLDIERSRLKVDVTIQVIVTAQKWTPRVESLVLNLADPVVCITDHLESVIYSGIKVQVSCSSPQKKLEKLVGILKEVEGEKRAVVVCKNKSDVKCLEKVLHDVGFRLVLSAHEEDTSVHVTEVSDFWKKDEISVQQLWEQSCTTLPILVRSDEVLEEVVVNDAEILIHYDLPNTYKTFGLRFTCILDHFRNIFKKDVPYKKCGVYVFMDEQFERQLGPVMKFVERTGTAVPEFIKHLIEEAEQKKEKEKLNQPLCEDLKMFGKCWRIKKCPNRHILSDQLDIPQDIPKSGRVKVLIQHVHDACHFSARLLASETPQGEWRTIPAPAVSGHRLDIYFGHERNRRAHGEPEVGDLVAVGSYQRDEFHRAVVLKITHYTRRKEAERVNLRLIDNGRYEYNIHVVRLYHLPEELKSPLPAVVDCYLTNLMPKDLDMLWSSSLTEWLQEKLWDASRDCPQAYVTGKIVLSLGRSLWLDPVECKDYLPINKTTIVKFSLREDLLKNKHAVENSQHIPNLRSLCTKAGIQIEEDDKEEKAPAKPSQPKPQWAWLPQDISESAYVVTIQAPDIIFLRLIYFTDCLDQLTKELQKSAVEDQEQVRLLDVGNVCLAKVAGEDEWNRAMISKKISDDEVELFFVDFGDLATISWSEVALIPNHLITKLPFQAIECCLAGVQFINGEESDWEDQAVDYIVDLTRDSDEKALNLQVKVCGIESVGMLSKGKRYKVVLTDDRGVVVNKTLASSEFAQLAENEKHFLDKKQGAAGVEDFESDCGSGNPDRLLSPDIKIITTIQKPDGCEVLLPDDFNIDDKVAKDENEQRVFEFLRNLEEGDFVDSDMEEEVYKKIMRIENGECSDNDADISEDDNCSEGSVKSLPQSRGCLPQTTGTPLNIIPVSSLSQSSLSSESLKSSPKGSNMSLNEDNTTLPTNSVEKEHNSTAQSVCKLADSSTLGKSQPEIASSKSPLSVKETCVVLNEEYIKSLSDTNQQTKFKNCSSLVSVCSPFIHSTPEVERNCRTVETPLSPLTISHSSPASDHSATSLPSPSSLYSGVGKWFKDMVSPVFKPTQPSSSISPKLKFSVEKTMPIYEHVSRSSLSPSSNDAPENNQVDSVIDEVEENKTKNTIGSHAVLAEFNLSSKNYPPLAVEKNIYTNISSKETLSRNLSEEFKNISGEEVSTENIDANIICQVKVPNESKETSKTELAVKEKQQTTVKHSPRWVEQQLLLSSDEEPISTFLEDQSGNSQGAGPTQNDVIPRHPLVCWHENENYVWIHVKLSSLKTSQYKFTCDATSFEFSAFNNGTTYEVKLELFAPHNVENVLHAPKAFHVEIRLEKILKGKRFFWNQLTVSNEKFHWLRFNAEMGFANLDDSEDEDVKRYALSLPSGNDTLTDTESYASSEASDVMDCDELNVAD